MRIVARVSGRNEARRNEARREEGARARRVSHNFHLNPALRGMTTIVRSRGNDGICMHMRLLCLTAACAAVAMDVSGAQGQAPDTIITGSGRTATVRCADGGGVAITGTSNTVTITGFCARVSVTGSDNKVSVELAAGARMAITGVSNTVHYSAPADAPPEITVVGTGSSVVPMQ
jgi:hypothetical protein